MSQYSEVPFSDFIVRLPKADIPMPGVTGHLLGGKHGQVVFFELPAGAEVPPHSHGAQWGIVASGKIELTIGGRTAVYTRGDSYEIGDGEVHAGKILEDSQIIDVFSQADRYSAKAE